MISKYFYSIKINLLISKFIFSIKTNLYSTKYIYMTSDYKFNGNRLASSQQYFNYIYFFHSSKIFFYYMNFSSNTFLMSISGLPFVFTKVKILLSVCKLNSSTRV